MSAVVVGPSAVLTACILVLVTLQRLSELVIARANTARLMRAGAVEHGASHYPAMVLMHAAWLIGLWALAWGRPVDLALLAVFAVLQAGRVWVLATLGRRWTTRIVTVPGERLVARGPFRLVRHPNYVVVTLEIACLPAVFGLWGYALLFTVLNGLMLFVRIRAENAALASSPR